MKICIIHFTCPPIVGGVESVLGYHAQLMREAGHDVTILAGRGARFAPDIEVVLLPLLDSRHPQVLQVKKELDAGQVTEAFEELKAQIEQELAARLKGYDVIIAHNIASLHKNLPLTAALYALHEQNRLPLVLWHHDFAWVGEQYRSELYPRYPWNLLRQAWPGAIQVVISEVRRRQATTLWHIPSESIRVIPNGVDLRAFFKLEPQTWELVQTLNLLEADPLFLLPVRLTARKNIELALRVMAHVRLTFPQARLIVTGPEGAHNPANTAYREQLFRLRSALHLEEAVHFMAEMVSAPLPDAVIADFYRLADALLLPSREEGFGLPVLEAGFSRMPVFCSDLEVLRELGQQDVVYFEPDVPAEAIAQQICRRLESDPLIRMARRLRQRYTWPHIYAEYIEPLLAEVSAAR
ncbi:MAG: glycosyltransferase family 4 protein [Anaerolineales bacterium]